MHRIFTYVPVLHAILLTRKEASQFHLFFSSQRGYERTFLCLRTLKNETPFELFSTRIFLWAGNSIAQGHLERSAAAGR
jgi:hypothetical protein